MAELVVDVVEQILVRLDVKDLIRCKSVCKSWQSVISSPRFVRAHLNHAYTNDANNPQLGHRRIYINGIPNEDQYFYLDCMHIVGSCNGLVCVSPTGVEFLVSNPCTRELKRLPTPRYRPPHMHKLATIRIAVCWGFGYDSSADDYVVVVGFQKRKRSMLFYALTLKSNTWKVIGRVNCRTKFGGKSGILRDGALYWFMNSSTNKKKKVIISLDISTKEFKEIPLPPDVDLFYDIHCYYPTLGVIEECLCIYSKHSPLSTNKWVMKNNYNWELYTMSTEDQCRRTKYDVAHRFPKLMKPPASTGCFDDGIRVPAHGDYVRAAVFVKSLVSPHPQVQGQKERGKQKRKRNKMRKRVL